MTVCEKGKGHIWYPYTQMQTMAPPVQIERTEGCTIHLEDGTTLIDGIASWWSACHGYNHPTIEAAVEKQLKTMPHIMFAGTAHKPAYELATRLAKLTGLERAFLTDSGSTAVETAMKIAVQYWKNKGQKRRNKFISFENGYHGDTMGCMSLADPQKGMHSNFNHYMPMQYNIPIPSDEYGFKEFDSLLKDEHDIAAVIIEPLVQGAGGMKFHSADILAELYRITKKHNILFIADEVMTGFGRTGNFFACEEAGITPDLMCLGKALSGGTMTLAATMAGEKIFESFLSDSLSHALMSGPTFMANPLACAAANASLSLFEDDVIFTKINAIERAIYDFFEKVEHEKIIDKRVKGAIGVIELDTNWDGICRMRKAALDYGVWLRPFGNILYIMPAFTITQDELNTLFTAMEKMIDHA